MSNDMYLPALPIIQKEFHNAAMQVNLTIGAWLAGDASLLLIAGPLADRYGRRPLLFWGGLLFLIATFLCAVAPNLPFLLSVRFLQGMGVCTMMVAGYASVHSLYTEPHILRLLSWMGSAAIIAPALGPLFGAIILAYGPWQVIFYVLFALSLLALIGLWFSMPESQPCHPLPFGTFRPFLQIYRAILSNPLFVLTALSFTSLYGCVVIWLTFSPFLFLDTLAVSPLWFGLSQVGVFGAYAAGALFLKKMVSTHEREHLILSGLLLAGGSALALLGFPLWRGMSPFSLLLPMGGYMMGFGIASAALQRAALAAVSHHPGSGLALLYLLVTGAGTALSVGTTFFPQTPLWIGGFFALIAWLALLFHGISRCVKPV